MLGYREVPADAYYGIHTLRALENFPISGDPISKYPELIVALVDIKEAAALTNRDLGLLDDRVESLHRLRQFHGSCTGSPGNRTQGR
ncbi:hypothetical protein Tamer19_21120 [Cupriavidus sp. TA19]|nr:hypothetical protein [Cupriavidus sp. TA19]GLC92704.1 hypothetical protein Tamer19_21120 [Cupriavidus sp. TA19]